jgi:predicted aminopeptidase
MRRNLRFFLLLSFFIPLAGCGNLLYLSKLGWHQSFITFQSVPVQDVLSDDVLEEAVKEKIRLIQAVKRYGEERLGLEKTGSYAKYYEIQGPALHVVTASEKDRFHLHSWNFPIIGRVTYKSFFTREGALKEKRLLDQKGYDTFLQQVAAYSTLGWLKDSIFSTMLKWDEPTLTNIILHEMAHATIYFKGETGLNEQLATFIGNRGAVDLLTEKYGSGSKEVALAVDYQEDDLLFGGWVDRAHRQLSEFYDQPVSREEKLKGRDEFFRSIQQDFGEMKHRFKTDCYQGVERVALNNAVILAYRQYFHRLDRWENLYHAKGRDLRKVVEFLKEIKSSGDKKPLASFLE